MTEIVFRLEFSETVNRDTIVEGIARSEGTVLGDISPASNHTEYLVPLSVAGMKGDVLTFRIHERVEDLAGNRLSNSLEVSMVVDVARPEPAISHSVGGMAGRGVLTFAVDFGEPVDPGRFALDDIAVSDGAASGLRAEPPGQNRTYAFNVTHGLSSGNLTVAIRANATADAAGNYNGASEPFTIQVGGETQIVRSLSESPQTAARNTNSTEADPVPIVVEVDAVPIVVNSTVADYFVLYGRHDLDDGTTVSLPIAVTLGENGTTTLAENVEALPPERYLVEKYLVADPADVDGDGIDDISELADPAGRNPVNPAAAINITDGAAAVPDLAIAERLSYEFHSGNSVYLKFVLLGMDTGRPSVYFMNSKTHELHQDFFDAIGLKWNSTSLQTGEIIRGWIIYDPNLAAPDGSPGAYYYQLFPYSSFYSFALVERSYALLAASMPLLEDNLVLYMENFALPSLQSDLPLYNGSRIDLVFDGDILPETSFLALNPGEGYGLLRVVEPDERPNPRDVVIYEALPNELPRVAGIISTVPQTPLSHVNLRAVQDRVPNAFIRGALDNPAIGDLVGSYVRYEVAGDGWDLSAATRAEIDEHYASSRPAGEQTPQRDLSVTSITPLGEIGFANSTAFGVKAANVAALGKLGFPDGTVPDGFAVPFYFYDEFMKHNGLYGDVEGMLADPDFQANYTVQEAELKKLRKAIKKAEAPGWMDAALEEMHGEFPNGTSLRYRSSTNNEDLPGFNGAGLYDSKTQHPEETEEGGISKSLKQVYASMWNFRAFVERDFFRINHTAAAMGVLVHPNYSDELANGVAVSFDPVRGKDRAYYVNTQVGEDLVTNPDAHSMPEELLLLPNGRIYSVLAASNLAPPGQLLMSNDQMAQLGRHLTVIHEEFKKLYNPGLDEPFAMEIEFKITSEDVLAIKQARPWVFSSAQPQHADDTTPPTFSSATYSNDPGILAITFSEDISGTADLSRLHVREAGHPSGGAALTGATQAVAGHTLTITLTGPQRTAVNALAAPELDIGAGAVSDLADNEITASSDNAIAVSDTAPPFFSSASYSTETGQLAVTFSEALNGTIHLDRLHVRGQGQPSSDLTLDGSAFSVLGNLLTATLTDAQRTSVGGLENPYLHIGGGAVFDTAGNPVGQAAALLVVDGAVVMADMGTHPYVPPPGASVVNVKQERLPSEMVAQAALSLDFSEAPSFESDANATTVILTETESVITTLVNGMNVTVTMPAGVNATGDATWDGIIRLPKPSAARPPPAGAQEIHTLRVVISIASSVTIHFDQAVRILMSGEGNPNLWVFVNDKSGSYQIAGCKFGNSQEGANNGLADGDAPCYFMEDGDLIIWTKHFSHFGTYTKAQSVPEPLTGQDETEADDLPVSPSSSGASTDGDGGESRGSGSGSGSGGGGSGSGGSGNGGGGGGGGGAPAAIITDVRIYSVSWDCAAGSVAVTAGPDTDQLSVNIRTSSVGERPVIQAGGELPGTRSFTSAIAGADEFAVVEASLAYEGDQVITKIVSMGQCAGTVVFDRYEPPRQAAPEPEPRELCRDGRAPALRDGNELLCLFPGTFEVLAERGWNLARP